MANNNGWGYPPQYPPNNRRNNNNNRNRNNNGWAQPQYPPRQQQQYYPPQYDEGPQYPFDIGQMVRHRYSGTELAVIRFGNEQIECRLPDLTSQWFYVHELEPLEATDTSK